MLIEAKFAAGSHNPAQLGDGPGDILTEQSTNEATAASTLASSSGRSSAIAAPTDTRTAALSAACIASPRR